MKKRILFICHGNICRSPMAEFLLINELKKRGLEESFQV
ncbi:MAG: low molecular weight phosphotyrosine protein phosphatase, partial [Bacteroidales bacterium]|nr:low molecular weight phosphotyrosine protein phosphatase [Bacteroidales bacterium]